jgi:hypothetical protein
MNLKLLIAPLAAVASLFLVPAQAATPSPEMLGTWEVDLSKSQSPPDTSGPQPKSVTMTLKDIGGGKWLRQRSVVLADGKKQDRPPVEFSTADGAASLVSGDPLADSATSSFPDSHTVLITFSKGGKTVAKDTVKLSADGKQVVEDVDTTDRNGKPYHFTLFWNKK